ncbi:hypothetical protein [Seonamhaeicola marinus]|uniref:Uncharacterized protein n=1 Tax=Seonamhaeicola marinus TaxID=1912246 RepID=A0A5D0HEJ0_9FLAO|nr:hypothetical protein [Seonamhaeicola marinus]TYA69794.1 hypothetical protein FUA24_21095 [Seonamhaeicola marinus]
MRILSPILLSLFFLFSCTKDVDFDQANNIILTPTAEASLAFTSANASDFLINGFEITAPTFDAIDIDIFNDESFNDNITRVDLVFETENTLSRDFQFTIGFINDALIEFETFSFSTADSSPHIITFEGADLELLKTISSLSYTIQLITSSGVPLTSSSTGEVTLKSKGVFYLNIEA